MKKKELKALPPLYFPIVIDLFEVKSEEKFRTDETQQAIPYNLRICVFARRHCGPVIPESEKRLHWIMTKSVEKQLDKTHKRRCFKV